MFLSGLLFKVACLVWECHVYAHGNKGIIEFMLCKVVSDIISLVFGTCI